jgi:hypothetical protein
VSAEEALQTDVPPRLPQGALEPVPARCMGREGVALHLGTPARSAAYSRTTLSILATPVAALSFLTPTPSTASVSPAAGPLIFRLAAVALLALLATPLGLRRFSSASDGGSDGPKRRRPPPFPPYGSFARTSRSSASNA